MALSSRYRFLQKIGIAALIAFCSFFLAGCGKGAIRAEKMWEYVPDSYQLGMQPLIHKSMAIPPFTLGRPDRKENRSWLHLIPLMPFGWFEYSKAEDVPDLQIPLVVVIPIPPFVIGGKGGEGPLAARKGEFTPNVDLAKAAADELLASGLFSEVFFAENPKEKEGELVLQGHVTSTRYWGKVTSYGLTVFGSWLWVLGFPLGAVHNELGVEFRLKEQGTGTVLWEKSYTLTYDKVPLWMQAPWDFYFTDLFKTIMQDVVKSLQSTFSHH